MARTDHAGLRALEIIDPGTQKPPKWATFIGVVTLIVGSIASVAICSVVIVGCVVLIREML